MFTHRDGRKELAPRAVIAKFIHTCQRTGLDPLARQIYCIGRLSQGEVGWATQTAIDGFRVIAERSQKYAGQDGAEWLTESGEWVPVFVKAIHGNHPLAARVHVYRHDWKEDKPAVGIATWDEYAQTTYKGELTKMWETRGPGQLAKCAEALALRKAFPQDLSGIFTDDEMQGKSAEPEAEIEPSGVDWAALLEAATTLDEINEISARIGASGEGNDALAVIRATRIGLIEAMPNTVDAEEVDDDEPANPEEPVHSAGGARLTHATGYPAGDGAVDPGSERNVGDDAGSSTGNQPA